MDITERGELTLHHAQKSAQKSLLDTKCNLAIYLSHQQQFAEAERLYEVVLSGYEDFLSSDTGEYIRILGRLAVLHRERYTSQHDIKRGEELFRRAIKGKEAKYGSRHASTVRTMGHLAQLLHHASCPPKSIEGDPRVQEAEALFRASLSGKQAALGRDHNETKRMCRHFAKFLREQGRDAEAAELERQAREPDISRQLINAGNYRAAAQGLATSEMSGSEMVRTSATMSVHNAASVRAEVEDLTRRAEMKWRYLVLEEGESARDSAIKLLTEAQTLLEAVTNAHGAAARPQLRAQWAAELAAVAQGLATARLVHNPSRDEDDVIERFLGEAKELQQSAGLNAPLADTLNSCGELQKKQRAYDKARQCFEESLALRCNFPETDDTGNASETALASKAQYKAQSYISLGTLAIERGDAAREAGEEGSANVLYGEALEHMLSAKHMYVAGFSATHPKVARACQGLGDIYARQGKADLALLEFDAAARLWTTAAGHDKQMFAKELQSIEASVTKLQN